jgi:AraC-like DNA-binding protein
MPQVETETGGLDCHAPQCPARNDVPDSTANELMARITELMETQRLYLNPELKVGDVADALGVHRNAVSACINAKGCTFSQFVNDYRMRHAKQLLSQLPDVKISTIGSESGFANESTFFRVFKTATGMTPKEWAVQQQAVS